MAAVQLPVAATIIRSASPMSMNSELGDEPALEIDLRDPSLAALLGLAMPGAGHLYQRRTGKGLLFMVCILGTYFFGLALGEGKVVYASWNQVDRRWQYPLQLGDGPAGDTGHRAEHDRPPRQPPLLGGMMAPPRHADSFVLALHAEHAVRARDALHDDRRACLNILAIWDAYGGPVVSEPGKPERGPPGDDKSKDKTKRT